jgi:hypothetical protein
VGCNDSGAEEEPREPRPASVEALARRPEAFASVRVRVEGDLVNRGRDPYTELRLALTDCRGNDLEVLPWLPISVPSPPPGKSLPPRDVIVNFLDERVTLTGRLGRSEGPDGTTGWYLIVDDARVTPRDPDAARCGKAASDPGRGPASNTSR